jgi:hypothetical protein
MCSSTTFSSSRRRLQRAKPSGAGERVSAINFASATPSKIRGRASGAVFEAKYMLPWSFSEETAAEKHMAQLQHNMWVVVSRCYSLGRAYLPFVCQSLRRTPGPPPFSSMNSMPAASKARRTTWIVARRGAVSPASSCLTVTIPIPALSARPCWLQSRSPRAALHCAGDTMGALRFWTILSEND